jgi:plasmid maintenance system antidote protein VapI
MRTSTKCTPAAVLRGILGIKVAGMAELLGCSSHTIQSLETGRLKMSQDIASRMLIETDISPQWLLAGDAKVPPYSVYDMPYTKEIFEHVQAEKAWRKTPKSVWLLSEAVDLSARLVAILSNANKHHNYVAALYKARIALERLKDEFGQDDSLYSPKDFGDYNDQEALAIMSQLSRYRDGGLSSSLQPVVYDDIWKIKDTGFPIKPATKRKRG